MPDDPLAFEQISIGGDKNFAYIFGDARSGQLAAVDPGCNPQKVLDRLAAHGGKCVMILATHSHRDHIAGIGPLQQATGAVVAGHRDVPGVDRALSDGETFKIGEIPVRVTHCPGHCADSILLEIDGRKLLVGDELFIGGVGITRSESQARVHHANLHARLLSHDDSLEVYPGHDYGAAAFSTLGEQRRGNPYLLAEGFEKFWHLRRNWKQYVADHGLKWG